VALGASFHKAAPHCGWTPRSFNIRLSAALLLRNVAKLKNELTVLFLDDDLHFLENHLTAI
jgi:hypothetical protein